MIVDAMALILVQLNQYIRQVSGGTSDPAIWGNIAQVDSPEEVKPPIKNQIVLTLVNIEEEQTMKNGKTFTANSGNTVNYHNPPLYLNLFLLFTSNYNDYETALKRLTQVVTFFQGKQKFTLNNSPMTGMNPESRASLIDFSLTLDLLSLCFEEVNHLWGSLGGKQLPFVAYRGRLVTITDRRVLEGGGRVEEIDITSRGTTP
jgi:hypothetical protein